MSFSPVPFEGGRVAKNFEANVTLRGFGWEVLSAEMVVSIRLLVEPHPAVHAQETLRPFPEHTPGNCKVRGETGFLTPFDKFLSLFK